MRALLLFPLLSLLLFSGCVDEMDEKNPLHGDWVRIVGSDTGTSMIKTLTISDSSHCVESTLYTQYAVNDSLYKGAEVDSLFDSWVMNNPEMVWGLWFEEPAEMVFFNNDGVDTVEYIIHDDTLTLTTRTVTPESYSFVRK